VEIMKKFIIVSIILILLVGAFSMDILGRNITDIQRRMVGQTNYRINVVKGIVESANINGTFNCYIAGETVVYPNIPTFSRNPKLQPGDEVTIEFINGCRETPAILAPEDIRERPDTTLPGISLYEEQLIYVVTSYSNLANPAHRIGMPILAISDHNVSQVHVFCKRFGTPGIVNVNIYDADINKKPTGPVLSTGNFDGDTLGVVGEWKEIEVAPLAFSSGDWYVIVFDVPGAGSWHYFRWYGTFANVYPGAVGVYSNNAGATWSYLAIDYTFKIYG